MAILTKMKAPKLTGTANALTRGRGNKYGLRKQAGPPADRRTKLPGDVLPTTPPTGVKAPYMPKGFLAGGSEGIGSKLTIAGKQPTASTGPRPGESLGDWGDRMRREGGFTGVPAKSAPVSEATPKWFNDAKAKLTGQANALTRGKGKKVGLRKPAAPKPRPGKRVGLPARKWERAKPSIKPAAPKPRPGKRVPLHG